MSIDLLTAILPALKSQFYGLRIVAKHDPPPLNPKYFSAWLVKALSSRIPTRHTPMFLSAAMTAVTMAKSRHPAWVNAGRYFSGYPKSHPAYPAGLKND